MIIRIPNDLKTFMKGSYMSEDLFPLQTSGMRTRRGQLITHKNYFKYDEVDEFIEKELTKENDDASDKGRR